MPNLFGMCLTLGGGAWDLGFVNASRAAGPIAYVPVSAAEGYYAVSHRPLPLSLLPIFFCGFFFLFFFLVC